MVQRFPSDDLKHNTFRGWAPFSPEIPPTQFWTLYFVMTISITSQQNVCEEKKVIEQFQLFIFGTEVLISLISSLGGWWGCGWVVFLAKGTKSRTLVFLISDKKKGTSKLTKMAILRKKGTFGSQWQSLINSPFCQRFLDTSLTSQSIHPNIWHLQHTYKVHKYQPYFFLAKK